MLSVGHSMTSTFEGLVWDEAGWQHLFEAAKAANLMVFTDVFGLQAFESLNNLPPVDGLKLHGADVGNTPLLEALSETDYPILIGTGGCSDLDLHLAVSGLGKPNRLVLMHGYQGFPCPLEDTALMRIPHLQNTFGIPVGLSDHLAADDNFSQLGPLMAIPLGICCVEKHLTLDRSAKGIDHESSLNVDEMTQLAKWIRQGELAQGSVELPASASEAGYRKRFKKSLISVRAITKGETINSELVTFNMVEDPPRYSLHSEEALNRTAGQDIPAGRILSAADLDVSTGICIIARLKSQRLPRKALVDIHGKPALAHLLERAKAFEDVGRIVLCTSTHPDDAPLISLAREWGIESYAGSPEQPLDRLIACAEMHDWQYVVRLTADNLFTDPDVLRRAVALAQEENLDYVSTSTVPVGVHCEVFSTFALRVVQKYAEAPYTTEYLTWFVADNPNFRSMDLSLDPDLQRNYRLTLDTPEDLLNISDLISYLPESSNPHTLREIIQTVESHPDLEKRCTMVPGNAIPPAPVRFNFKADSALNSSASDG
jgi:N,N'-diacetyllegionaminate synthase